MSLAEVATRLLADEERWASNPSLVWGLSTGFPSWDQITHGLHPGEVTVVAARLSSGKTALGLQVALAVAQDLASGGDPGRVAIVSPEMTAEPLAVRMASILSRVPALAVRSGEASSEQRAAWRAAVSHLGQLDRQLILPNAGLSIAVGDLVGELEALHREQPLRLVVIDYLQVITAGGRTSYESATEVSRRLRDLANRLRVPLVVMSQLARPGDKQNEPPPSIYEIRDSGNVEQDADNVLLLYRPLKLGFGEAMRASVAEVTVAKQRQGPLGSFKLYFHASCTRFEDLREVTING